MLLATNDTTIQVTLISTVGLILVAIIGVWQIKATNEAKTIATSAKNEAKTNAEEAVIAAQMAKDYAAAMSVKDSLVASLQGRVEYLEEQNIRLMERLDECERRDEEHHEQQRAASLIERTNFEEINRLRRELESRGR